MRIHPLPDPVRRAAVVLGLTAAFLTGCGTAAPTNPPAATAAATATSAPGSTDPGAGLGDPLAAFEGRLRDATTREGALVRAIAAASSGRAADMRLAVTQMREWIDGERTWLAAHPARECFAAAAAKYGAAVDAMSIAADAFAATATGSPVPSGDPVGAAAGQALQDAARALAETAGLAKTSRPNCR